MNKRADMPCISAMHAYRYIICEQPCRNGGTGSGASQNHTSSGDFAHSKRLEFLKQFPKECYSLLNAAFDGFFGPLDTP